MNRIARTLILLTLAAIALSVPADAFASGAGVRRDCIEDGKLDRRWPVADLRDAISNAPSNEDEYSGDCRDLIRAELARLLSGRKDGPAGAGGRAGGIGGVEGDRSADGIPDTDEDFEALQAAISGGNDDDGQSGVTNGGPEVALGSRKIVPKAPPAALARVSNELPASMLFALSSLAALALVAGLIAARRRLPQLSRATLRLIRH